jgi:hypothetical protein
MELTPLNTFHDTTNHLFILCADEKELLVKCYTGPHAVERWQLEKTVLTLWYRRQYPVPRCHPIRVPGLAEPYLVMDYLKGICISEFLSDKSVPQDKKLKTLKRIFQNNLIRHEQALALNDPRLVQYDANTGNIVITASGCFHVDFETPPKNRPITDLVCKEIAKFCRWAVRDMGRDSLSEVVTIVREVYHQHLGLLERIIALPTHRPFQFFHRFRDARKKKRYPGEVTKYDIADGLKHSLGAKPSPSD